MKILLYIVSIVAILFLSSVNLDTAKSFGEADGGSMDNDNGGSMDLDGDGNADTYGWDSDYPGGDGDSGSDTGAGDLGDASGSDTSDSSDASGADSTDAVQGGYEGGYESGYANPFICTSIGSPSVNVPAEYLTHPGPTIAPGNFNFDWSDITGSAGYRVEVDKGYGTTDFYHNPCDNNDRGPDPDWCGIVGSSVRDINVGQGAAYRVGVAGICGSVTGPMTNIYFSTSSTVLTQKQPLLLCSDSNPAVRISWNPSNNPNTRNYIVYYQVEGDPNTYGSWVMVPWGEDNPPYTGPLSFDFSTSSPPGDLGGPGMISGSRYRFNVYEVYGPGNVQESGWSAYTEANCSLPPDPFNQNLPQAFCNAPGSSVVRLSWSPSSRATDYYVHYTTPSGGINGGWSSGGNTYFDITQAAGFSPGTQLSFAIYAVNGTASGTWSDSSSWSHVKFGSYTAYPDCNPPGNFTLSSAPNGACTSVNNPRADLAWGQSAGASNYTVYYREPQTSYANTTALNRSVTGLTPNQQYSFLVAASKNNSPYITYANNAWSSAVYGPTTYPDCSMPQVNITLTNTNNNQSVTYPPGGIPLTVKQTEPVTLSWNTTGSLQPGQYSCTNSISSNTNPTENLSSIWNLNASGSGLINLPLLTGTGTHQFSLSCTSNWGINNLGVLNLNVIQLQLPFIQTTEGDIHTNESINIPQN